jgi:hypothetical protein
VLSISVAQPTVDFGDVTQGTSTGPVPVGNVLFTNTLDNGAAWSTTVAATSLVSGANAVPFTALTFAPGSSIVPDAGAVGTPVAGSAGSFTGSDSVPGTSFSNPLTLSTAQPAAQGSYTQGGSTVSLAAPASQPSGSYAGTLQYTILAGPTT